MFQILPYKMSLALILKILLQVIGLDMFYKTQITSKNTFNSDLWLKCQAGASGTVKGGGGIHTERHRRANTVGGADSVLVPLEMHRERE